MISDTQQNNYLVDKINLLLFKNKSRRMSLWEVKMDNLTLEILLKKQRVILGKILTQICLRAKGLRDHLGIV